MLHNPVQQAHSQQLRVFDNNLNATYVQKVYSAQALETLEMEFPVQLVMSAKEVKLQQLEQLQALQSAQQVITVLLALCTKLLVHLEPTNL